MTADRSGGVAGALNAASLSRFHLRAVLVSGMGFFTDAYDLFIIGIASTLIQGQWHLSTTQLGMLNAMTLLASFLGAVVFGRIADLLGRKRVYGLEAALMVVAAIGSSLAPSFLVLVAFRFLLGLGVGGDYPVSAVLMSEYANQRDRGKLVGLVFGTQALGLIVGPIVGLTVLGAGVSPDPAWRIMLALGAVPAAAVIYFRRRMPESPRYAARVQGQGSEAADRLASYSGGAVIAETTGQQHQTRRRQRLRLRDLLVQRRFLLTLLGTAGTWFAFDYAYYGNTISTPQILTLIVPHASHIAKIAVQLLIFVVAALPGYALAIMGMDRIGHRRLQWIGFAGMAVSFALIAAVPGVAATLAPFVVLYGVSYFFAEFGPNTTTFVLGAELYPVSARATGHGLSAGIAKAGAFLGVFVFPFLKDTFGLRGTLAVTTAVAVVGGLLTLILPEPAGRSLEEVSGEDVIAAAEHTLTAHPADYGAQQSTSSTQPGP